MTKTLRVRRDPPTHGSGPSGTAPHTDAEWPLAYTSTRLSELAAEYQLSVYDAAYLELAPRRRLVLGCKDGPLRSAATRAGVGLRA